MQHKLPDKIFGISTEEAYQKYLEESKKKQEIARVKPEQQLEVKANINLSDYIKVPNTNVLISKEETHKGLTWENTHYALADNGLFMPSPALFMPYLLNVRDAAQGRLILYDGNNNSIPKSDVKDLYKYMTSDYRGSCFTWLDAMFKEGSGNNSLDIETDHRIVVKNGKKTLQGRISPLERCVDENCFVDLDFNKQGLVVRKSRKQEYGQDKNLYYWEPFDGKIARFGATFVGACFDCDYSPSNSSSLLGVFACAEGTPRQKIK